MNPHIGAAMWIVAMLVGFVIWWPIGAAILASITFTALCQQITGYRLAPPQPRRSVGEEYVYSLKLERELEAAQLQIKQAEMRQIKQVEVRQITDRTRK